MTECERCERIEEVAHVMKRAENMERDNEHHTDGYGSADDLRVLRKEILRLRIALGKAQHGRKI